MMGPINSNWLFQSAMSSLQQTSSMNGSGAANGQMPGMAGPGSFMMLLMAAMMENVQQMQSQQMPTQQAPAANSLAFMTPASSSYNPTVANLTMEHKDVATSAADQSDLKFRPVQFLKLDGQLNGKLSGSAVHFIEAGKKYDIDPNLLSAIAVHETGNGSSRAANEKNNIAGMMGKNGLRSYESVADSIYDMARNLRQNYLNQGKESIAQIGAKYAPVGAANDPTGLNNHWTQGVSKFYTQLT
ncbi:glucosaminidase domain-containing protein [Planococcus rifietoensis]|uniref:glucosaminidase domain-containing protein n=1 Tax=Planococcus rifietoensis TaxID=200991 RepID=UPI00384B32FA